MKAGQIEVVFAGSDVIEKAHRGETLLSCIRRAGLFVDSPCDGHSFCGKCKVSVQGELTPPDDRELAHLIGRKEDVRLACMAKVLGRVEATITDEWTHFTSVFGVKDSDIALDSPVKRTMLHGCQPRSSRPYLETLSCRTSDPRVLNKIAVWNPRNKPDSRPQHEKKLVPHQTRILALVIKA